MKQIGLEMIGTKKIIKIMLSNIENDYWDQATPKMEVFFFIRI